MALTLSANFTDAMVHRKTVVPRFWVILHTGTSTTHDFADGANASGWHVAVGSVATVTRALDPVTRVAGSANCDISLALDDRTKALITTEPLFATKIEVLLGTDTLGSGDFEPYWAGKIDDIIVTETSIKLKCKGYDDRLKRDVYRVSVVGEHPLNVAEDYITSVLGTNLVDTATFDPSDSAYGAISHFVVSRGRYRGGSFDVQSTLETNVQATIDDISHMLQGSVLADEDGQIRFRLFDPSASVAATWTESDLDDVVMASQFGTLVNRITLKTSAPSMARPGLRGPVSVLSDEDRAIWVQLNDTASQARFKAYGAGYSANTSWNLNIANRWLGNGVLNWRQFGEASKRAWTSTTLPAVADKFILDSHAYRVSGAHWPSFPGTAQPAWAKINADASPARYLYLMIDKEVVKFDTPVISTEHLQRVRKVAGDPDDYPDSYFEVESKPNKMTVTCDTRGDYGSSAVAHNNWSVKPMYDVTIPIYTMDTLLERFSNGAPEVECMTSLAQYAVQVGDLVSLVTTRIVWFDHASGATTKTKWEVTKKTIDVHASPPHIKWTLVYASDTEAASVTKGWDAVTVFPDTGLAGVAFQSDEKSITQNAVISGLGASSSGLVFTVAVGRVSSGVGISDLHAASAITLIAMRDNYVLFDISSSGIMAQSATIGAAEPTFGAGSVLLYRATTDTVNVTRTSDLRSYKGVPGGNITPQTVGASSTAKGARWESGISNLNFGQRTLDSATDPPDAWLVGRDTGTVDNEEYEDPTLLNDDKGTFSATTTISITLGFTPSTTATDFGGFILAVSSDTDPTISSIGQSNVTWTAIRAATGTGRSLYLWHGEVNSSTTPGTAITVNLGASASGAWIISEHAELDGGTFSYDDGNGSDDPVNIGTLTQSTYGKVLMIGACTRIDSDTGDGFGAAELGFAKIDEQQGPTGTTATTLATYYRITEGTGIFTFQTTLADADVTDDWTSIQATISLNPKDRPMVDTTVWDPDLGDNTIYESTTVSNEGGRSLRFTLTHPVDRLIGVKDIPVEPGRGYSYEIVYQRSGIGSTDVDPLFWYVEYDGVMSYLRDVGGVQTAGTVDVWETFTGYFVASSDASRNDIWVGCRKSTGVGAAQTMYIDRVNIKRALCDVHAYDGTGVSYSDSTWATVDCDTEVKDHLSDYPIATDVFAARTAGDYIFSGGIAFASIATTKRIQLRVYNVTTSSVITAGPSARNFSGGNSDLEATVQTPSIKLAAGDQVKLQVYHTHGSAKTNSTGSDVTWFAAKQLTEE